MSINKRAEMLADALPVYSVSFQLDPVDSVWFDTFPGVVIRGALCSVMRGMVCVARHTECEECYVQNRCAYARLFVSRPPEDAEMMKLYPSTPHPFALRYADGWGRRARYRRPFSWRLLLMGDAKTAFPFVLRTVERLQETGLGPDRDGFELRHVWIETGRQQRDMLGDGRVKGPDALSPVAVKSLWKERDSEEAGDLQVHLRTPVRLRHDGDPANPLSFAALVAHLCRRLSALAFFEGNAELDWDFQRLVERARMVEIKGDDTHWEKFDRYSGRQNRCMPFGGLIGSVTYRSVPPDLAAIVRFGQLIGAGRHTTFGLGEYEVIKDE